MSSIVSKADLPYNDWVQRVPPPAQPPSTRTSRNSALKELLIPFKRPVNEAVAELKLQLQRIDQGLTVFLQAEQSAVELFSRYSALFRDLQIPVQLAHPDAQTLLREYVDLARGSTSSNPTVGETISALGILRSDIDHRFQAERMSRVLAAYTAKQELLGVLRDRGPLKSLLTLLDLDSAPAQKIFAKLELGFSALAGILSSLNIGETNPGELQQCILGLEQSFHELLEATTAYRSPDVPMSSDQLRLAELPKLYRNLGFGLPPQVFDDPHADLHALTRDEKQAYLVVTRHLDVLATVGGDNPEFTKIAIRERDQLLEDMIRRLEISGAGSLIANQARRFTDERADLNESLNAVIIEANERLEEELVRIQCEVQVNDDIARYLARQRFRSEDLEGLLKILADSSDLQQSVAAVLRNYGSTPSIPAHELREYFEEFADVLSVAREISPILIDSIVHTPGQELASTAGLRRYRDELEVFKNSPEKLRAQEVSTVTSMTAVVLEQHFPCAHHVSAQYLVAAQIVVQGFAPHVSKGQVERPVRDCRSVLSLVTRGSSASLSVPIIHETIQSHLIPHLLVCKNNSEKNPAKKLYQLQRSPHEKLVPVTAHLEYLANHPLAHKKKGIPNPSSPSRRQQGAPEIAERWEKVKPVDPAEQLRIQQQVKDRAVTGLRTFIEECEKEIAASVESASRHTDAAQQLHGLLDKIGPLSARLSSSLHNGLTFQEQTSYRNDLEKACFSKLRQRVGFNPLGLNSKSQKAKAKRMSSHDVTELVVDCMLQITPGAQGVLEAGKGTFGKLKALEEQLSSPTLSFLRESFTTLRTTVAACRAKTHPSDSERVSILASYIGIISNPEPFLAVQRALRELSDELHRKAVEHTTASSILQAKAESAHDGAYHQGGSHGNN